MNSADQGGCHPQTPKAEVDNCFIIHSKYFLLEGVSPLRSLFFRSPNITQPCPHVFSVNGSIICDGLHFWRHFDVIGSIIFGVLHFLRHWFNMTKILSKFGEQQLVMVNYACGFNQSETGKYFEWIMIHTSRWLSQLKLLHCIIQWSRATPLLDALLILKGTYNPGPCARGIRHNAQIYWNFPNFAIKWSGNWTQWSENHFCRLYETYWIISRIKPFVKRSLWFRFGSWAMKKHWNDAR